MVCAKFGTVFFFKVVATIRGSEVHSKGHIRSSPGVGRPNFCGASAPKSGLYLSMNDDFSLPGLRMLTCLCIFELKNWSEAVKQRVRHLVKVRIVSTFIQLFPTCS